MSFYLWKRMYVNVPSVFCWRLKAQWRKYQDLEPDPDSLVCGADPEPDLSVPNCQGSTTPVKSDHYQFFPLEVIRIQSWVLLRRCVKIIINLVVIFQFGGPKIIPAARRGEPQNPKRGKLGRSCSQQYHRAAQVHSPPPPLPPPLLHPPFRRLRF